MLASLIELFLIKETIHFWHEMNSLVSREYRCQQWLQKGDPGGV